MVRKQRFGRIRRAGHVVMVGVNAVLCAVALFFGTLVIMAGPDNIAAMVAVMLVVVGILAVSAYRHATKAWRGKVEDTEAGAGSADVAEPEKEVNAPASDEVDTQKIVEL